MSELANMQNPLEGDSLVKAINIEYDNAVELFSTMAATIGRQLIECKKECKKSGQSWGELTGRADGFISVFHFGHHSAAMFMAISEDEWLTNVDHGLHLPPSWHTQYEISRLEFDQKEAMLEDGTINVDMERKDIAAWKGAIKKKEREEAIKQQEDELNSSEVPILDRKYHVISIDPPWPYEGGEDNSYDAEGRRVANPYPEMSIEDIANLDIPCADDSVLWLWTTHKFLPDAFDLLDAWGFDYKATMVWDKQNIGMGHWLRMQCEFCLLAIKGSPVWSNTTERDLLSAKRREHSRKPDEFFSMVDGICTGAKIEYFSREKREGWDQFGNDLEKFDEIL